MATQAKSSAEIQMVYHGAGVSDIAIIFDMSKNEVNERIAGKVAPVGVDAKIPRYRIRDVAPYLCNVVFDPEEFLRNLSPAKLPPALQDAFWKAQRNRQAFEEDKGDLWKTQRVIETLAEVFKTIRMTILMFNDTLEQKTELTPKQRQVIQKLGDGLLKAAHENLVNQFKDYVPPSDEHGRPLKEEEAHSSAMVVHNDPEPFDDGFDD